MTPSAPKWGASSLGSSPGSARAVPDRTVKEASSCSQKQVMVLW